VTTAIIVFQQHY